MTDHALLMIVQMIVAAALAWSCFCRLVATDEETHREIRLAIWFQGVVSLLALMAPVLPLLVPELHGTEPLRWMPGYTPAWVYLLVLISAALMQLVTSQFWRYSVPSDFQTRGFLP